MNLIEPGETVLNLLVAPLQHLKQLPLHPPEATLERLVAEEVHHKNRNKNFWRNNRTLYKGGVRKIKMEIFNGICH